MTAKSSAVSLYLLEPNTCEYFLSVESPWICDFIQSFNSDGVQGKEFQEEEEDNEQLDKTRPELEQNQEKPIDNQNTNEKQAHPVKEEQP